MSLEVHIEWRGQTHLVGRLHGAGRISSVSFQYAPEWLQRDGAFAIDPTSLPLQQGAHHGATLWGAIQDCGPDRWGRILIERAVRKKVLTQKPYRDLDYVLALDDAAYDINPVPEMDRVRLTKTAVTEDQEEPTIASAFAAAPRFGLKASEAKQILRMVCTVLSGWRKTGRQLRLKASTLDAYASAFDHAHFDEAKRLSGGK